MSINLTDEIEVKTKKGKLGAAKQIFLEGDTQTVEKEIQDINSRHNSLNTKHESLNRTVQGIAATGGASTATNVTYNNDNSELNAENVQDAIDEVNSKLIYDVSARNNGAVFESLQSLLSSDNLNTLIPSTVRYGGMSIRFVQSSDNKYVCWRYLFSSVSIANFANVNNWVGVSDYPSAGSDDLVNSSGIAKAIVDGNPSYIYLNKHKFKNIGKRINNNGVEYSTLDTGYRTTGFIDITNIFCLYANLRSQPNDNIVSYYDSDYHYIDGVAGTNILRVIDTSTIPVGTRYVRFCTNDALDGSVRLYYCVSDNNSEKTKIEDTQLTHYDMPYINVYLGKDGYPKYTADSNSRTSNFIQIQPSNIKELIVGFAQKNFSLIFGFYDSDKKLISGTEIFGTDINPNFVRSYYINTIPESAKYICFSSIGTVTLGFAKLYKKAYIDTRRMLLSSTEKANLQVLAKKTNFSLVGLMIGNDGTLVNADVYCYTSDFYKVSDIKKIKYYLRSSTNNLTIAYYDSSYNYLSGITGTNYMQTGVITEFPSDAVFVRFCSNDDTSGYICLLLKNTFEAELDDKVTKMYPALLYYLSKDIIALKKKNYGNRGKLIDNNGLEYSTTDVGFYTTNPIYVSPNTEIFVRARVNKNQNIYSFYDAYGKYISGQAGDSSTNNYYVKPPSNATYVKFCTNDSGDGYVTVLSHSSTLQDIENLKDMSKNILKNISLKKSQFAHSYMYMNTNGDIVSTSDYNYYVTDYIFVNAETKIKAALRSDTNINIYSFFDENYQFISGKNGTTRLNKVEPIIPSNARYVKFCTNDSGDGYVNVIYPFSIFDKFDNLEKSMEKSVGDSILQGHSSSNIFRNVQLRNTFFRDNGKIWVDDSYNKIVLNPITDYDVADPSYIKVGDYFYMFHTGKPCFIDRSKDLVNWEKGWSQVFDDDFDYSIFPNFSNAWANDINYINGKYVDYIAIWTGNDETTYCIAMIANSIDGPWSYGGIVCPSHSNGGPVAQPIDPEYVNDGTNGYLIVGSFRGLFMSKLDEDGLVSDGNWIKIASNSAGEGSYVFRYKGYYYLFTSSGTYTNYTYHILIARSATLDANFVNKNGLNILSYNMNKILSSADNDTLYGPGHNGEIFTDTNGDMYMILHCHVKDYFSSNSVRPAIIMRIVEDSDGWLAFADKDGNVVTKPTWECSVPIIK